ncbi:succinate-semialdehyde dehydrogenase [NADP+] GabD [Fimicolochytrium jonesii]|uniref:succinate-semialdehyde dehydrogenase [NADP+] GabD n=1 Tax=Fimicolochytrium jonesii TaxID=1396493 RepID=UPI0022FDEAE4|nr:succinate-semialdehyde dehydrogenase [NADP+] GabD [Fimicolochytrium jonesii]KAI8818111.1 succinate-semialdehyde dehydrogenase [NADP+] GabD [Fimicolochytrium jonesii]
MPRTPSICHLIQWPEQSEASDTYSVIDPAHLKPVASVPDMDTPDVKQAISLAHTAQKHWARKTARERATVLHKWYQLCMHNQSDLAKIMTIECGKPLAESMGEVAYGSSFLRWFAEEASRAYGDVIPENAKGRRLLAIKQPVGVVAAITPWNFPNAMIARKVAPAIAAGCSIIVKPSAETPLSALAMAYLGEEAGLPPGVFNVVTASKGSAKRIGNEMTENALVRKITFTGSTAVGKLLSKQAASTMKKVSMELGGNAPFIVFDDADIDAAVTGCIASKFRNTGQTCVCANRVFVHSKIYDTFAAKLSAKIREMEVGHGLEPGNQFGPLITSDAFDKVVRHVEDAVGKGAKVLLGGKPHGLGGNFYEPTVLTGVTNEMLLAREETFGPVAGLIRFETESEVTKAANDTPFGLAAYFYTKDAGRIFRLSEALEYGIVGVNEGIVSTEVAPFGGIKESGLGREGSKYGMDDYMEIKYICIGGIKETLDA